MSLDPLLALLVRQPVVSGATLAAELGISRAAVWKQIDRLRQLGLEVEAQAGAGYRLGAPLQLLDAVPIRKRMSKSSRALLAELSIVTDTGSTSADLLAGQQALRSGTVLLAEAQTAGRGQRGRRWRSPIASGFLGSILWRFDRGLASLGGLSLAMGVCVAEALAAFGAQVQLKWPNDLVVDGRKLGGLLIDAGGEAQGACHVVLGLGLNGRLPAAVFDEIDQPAIDLHRLLGADIDRNALAAGLLSHLLEGLRQFASEGFAAFHPRYLARDSLRDRAVELRIGDAMHIGHADGVDDSARLRVRMNGTTRSFDVGEVRVRGVHR